MGRKGLERLEIERKRALSNHDAPKYAELCLALGIDDVEHPHLFELGSQSVSLRDASEFDRYFSKKSVTRKKRKRFRRPKNPVNYCEDKGALARIARVALMDFLPLERGERLYVGDMKKRLTAVLHAGYPVMIGYRSMQRGAVWDHLTDIQSEIRILAETEIPEILIEIDKKNRKLGRNVDSLE
jgi:hypothetical protein|tara:strand:- start:1003 stop:1554 length:552 start_codon:yes stop_codon:yes gene_type:complete